MLQCEWCDKEAVWVIRCWVNSFETEHIITICDKCHLRIYPFLDVDVSSLDILDAKRFYK